MADNHQNKGSNVQIKECKKQEFRVYSTLNKRGYDALPGLKGAQGLVGSGPRVHLWAGGLSNQPELHLLCLM